MVILNLVENKSPQKDNQPLINGWYIAQLVGELGFIIAIPLILFLLLGRVVDVYFETKVIFTLAGMGLALLLSTYIIYQKIQQINKND